MAVDQLDPGDKLACGLSFKKNLGNYSSFGWTVSVTVSKRSDESDDEFSMRGWASAQAELLRQVETSDELLGQVRPVGGSPDEWS